LGARDPFGSAVRGVENRTVMRPVLRRRAHESEEVARAYDIVDGGPCNCRMVNPEGNVEMRFIERCVVQVEAVLSKTLAVVAGDNDDGIVGQQRRHLIEEVRQLLIHELDGAMVPEQEKPSAAR